MSIEIVLQLSGVCQYPNGTTFNYQESESFATSPDVRKSLTDIQLSANYNDDVTIDILLARQFLKDYCHEEFDRLVALAEKSGMDIIAIIS